MPKKTVYVRDSDLAVWEAAERLAGEDSFSGVLTAALQRYLEDRRPVVGRVRFAAAPSRVLVTAIQPLSGGWLLGPPPEGGAPRQWWAALEELGVVTAGDRPQSGGLETTRVWVPASALSAIVVHGTPSLGGGLDVQSQARAAWRVLRERASSGQVLTYSELGTALGGLHPLHEVPRVLDVIARWCQQSGQPDLTGLVVSRRTGMPGADYWRMHGWADLVVPDQVANWRKDLEAVAKTEWPVDPPF